MESGMVVKAASFAGLLACAGLAVAGCGQRPVDRALTGGAIGAASGAVVGSTVGSPVTGAVVGGATGATIGAVTAPER
jgi:osmotically inducible lipoprotein OsmB